MYRAAGDEDDAGADPPPRPGLDEAVGWWMVVCVVVFGTAVVGGCPARGTRWALLLD